MAEPHFEIVVNIFGFPCIVRDEAFFFGWRGGAVKQETNIGFTEAENYLRNEKVQ